MDIVESFEVQIVQDTKTIEMLRAPIGEKTLELPQSQTMENNVENPEVQLVRIRHSSCRRSSSWRKTVKSLRYS